MSVKYIHVFDGKRWQRMWNQQSLPILTLAAWQVGTGSGWAKAVIAPFEPRTNDLPGMLVCRCDRGAWKMLRNLEKLPYDCVIKLARDHGSISQLMIDHPRAKHMLDDPLTAAILAHAGPNYIKVTGL